MPGIKGPDVPQAQGTPLGGWLEALLCTAATPPVHVHDDMAAVRAAAGLSPQVVYEILVGAVSNLHSAHRGCHSERQVDACGLWRGAGV